MSSKTTYYLPGWSSHYLTVGESSPTLRTWAKIDSSENPSAAKFALHPTNWHSLNFAKEEWSLTHKMRGTTCQALLIARTLAVRGVPVFILGQTRWLLRGGVKSYFTGYLANVFNPSPSLSGLQKVTNFIQKGQLCCLSHGSIASQAS